MSNPRVSVVIPTYNRQQLVIDAIESVLAQTYSNFEIIVVDDGSTDATQESIQPYLNRIVYEVQQNKGVAAARNAGLRLAQGELICFLDSDDLWKREKLEKQVQFVDSHPEYGLIATEIQGINAGGEIRGGGKAEIYQIHNGMVADALLFANWIQTSTVMLQRKCLEQTGGFDEDVGQFGEDWLLWMKVAILFPIYFLPEPLVQYRFHAEQLTTHQPEKQFRSLMQCLHKLEKLPQFENRREKLREAEYRICMARAWRNRAAGDYGLAMQKLKQACRLRRIPAQPAIAMLRTMCESKLQGLR